MSSRPSAKRESRDPSIIALISRWVPARATPAYRRGRLAGMTALAPRQRALAVLQGTECFGRRDGGADMIEVARILRLFRLLHLEQIGIVDLAAIGADGALAEQRIVGRHGLHLGSHRLAVRAVSQVGYRLEIVGQARVHARLHHG